MQSCIKNSANRNQSLLQSNGCNNMPYASLHEH